MPLIHIKSKKLEFKFDIQGKYTLLKGDSGIGKTTFYNLVSDMDNVSAGIQNLSKIKVVAVPRNFDNFKFDSFSGCVLIIDENCTIFNKSDCANILRKSDNYFIIINRGVNYLPVHVDSVYTLQSSNHFYTLKPLYSRFKNNDIKDIDSIIVEDSSSGFTFIQDVFSAFDILNRIKIETSNGASKIVKKIEEHHNLGKRNFVIFYDAAAFAGYIDNFIECMRKYRDSSFFVVDWDSFEHYLLGSKFFNRQLSLSNTGYSFESLEQYATFILKNIFPKYKKESLSPCFKRLRCKTCNTTSCSYRHMLYTDLIYNRLLIVYNFLNYKYDRVKVDFSYKIFNHENEILKYKYIDNNLFRIIQLKKGIVLLEDINNKKQLKLSVIELINGIQLGIFALSNPSELKDWSGWAGV